ncbi:hypothetical protein, partial [Roseibium aggregatum]|uniref:hypothetical protein n=1 Tax=Roseibium aggregatum TaxID=187304 RepID=UPI001A8E6D2B
ECGDGGHGFSNANFGWVRLRKVSYKADFAAKCSIGQSGLKPAMPRGGTIDFTGAAYGPKWTFTC